MRFKIAPQRQRSALWVGLGLLSVVRPAVGQTATLRGRVLTAGDQPLAGAEVGLVDVNVVVASRPDGTYQLQGLSAGRFTVFARAIGYRWVSTSLVLVAGDTVEQIFHLEPLPVTLPDVTTEAKWASRPAWRTPPSTTPSTGGGKAGSEPS